MYPSASKVRKLRVPNAPLEIERNKLISMNNLKLLNNFSLEYEQIFLFGADKRLFPIIETQ